MIYHHNNTLMHIKLESVLGWVMPSSAQLIQFSLIWAILLLSLMLIMLIVSIYNFQTFFAPSNHILIGLPRCFFGIRYSNDMVVFLKHAISRTSYLTSSSFFVVQISDPCIDNDKKSIRVWYGCILVAVEISIDVQMSFRFWSALSTSFPILCLMPSAQDPFCDIFFFRYMNYHIFVTKIHHWSDDSNNYVVHVII